MIWICAFLSLNADSILRSQPANRVEVGRTSRASEPTSLEGTDLSLGARVERIAQIVPFAILIYFAIQMVLRLAISENLEMDEAEIAGHGMFALGYGNSNPPLYDWIVITL